MNNLKYLIIFFVVLKSSFAYALPVETKKALNAARMNLNMISDNHDILETRLLVYNNMTYLDIQTDNAIVGISKSQGLSECFQESHCLSNFEPQTSYISQDELEFSGSASLFNGSNDQPILRLTTASSWKTGSAFIKTPKSTHSFSTFFSFTITEPYYSGADGFVFVIKSELESAGANAAGLGYSGIKNSMGIEFDTYLNYEYNDPDDHHIGIVLNGNSTHPLDYSYISPDFKNGKVWYVWIDYNGNTLEVRVNHCMARPEKPQLSKQIDISNIIGNNIGFFGFTGSTGGDWENHDILEWEFVERFDPFLKEVNFIRYYVDGSMDISGNGLSWETAFKTIHEAVNQAGCLVEIFIKQGHYVIQEPIILQAMQTNIYGGFIGNEHHCVDRTHNIITTIDGQNLNQCFIVEHEKNMQLDRLTINNGKCDNGGALFVNHATAFIKNVIFKNNHALYNGGAIWSFDHSTLELVNCLFLNNQAEQNVGGAIYTDSHSNTYIYNCTFYGNTSKIRGGALYFYKSNGNVVNSIFWNDTAKHDSEIAIHELSHIKITFSTIKGFFFGHGNRDDDPKFIDPDTENFQLFIHSPCINAGSEIIDRIENLDLSGNPRQKGRIDIGAYEFQKTFDVIKPTSINIQKDYIEAKASISLSYPEQHDLIVSLESDTINMPSLITIPSGVTHMVFDLTIPTAQMTEQSISYSMLALIDNYLTVTCILQVDENKTITFSSYDPNWAGDSPTEIPNDINMTEDIEIYDLDNSGDTNLEDVILALKILTSNYGINNYDDDLEKISLKTPIHLLKLLSIKEAPFIFEPLSNQSEQILFNLNNTFPTIQQQVKILTDKQISPLDFNTAINHLNTYLTDKPPDDIQKGLEFILMPSYFQKHSQSNQIQILIDGKDYDWSSVPNQVMDEKGDSYNHQQNMDMVKANALLNTDEQNLYVMIAMEDKPLTIQYFSFLIDFKDDNQYELEIIVFGWEDGQLYCRYNDMMHGLYNRPFQMAVAIDNIFEAKIPLHQFIDNQQIKPRISILPRTFDINLIKEDQAPKISLPVTLTNHALLLLLHLLEQNKFIQGDIMTVAMAIADNFIHSIADKKTMRAIERDICSHFDFYQTIISWQINEQLHYQLKDSNLIPKIFWADRCGKYFIYVSDVTDFTQLGKLRLQIYNEFIDRIDTMTTLFETIKKHLLYDSALNYTVSKIESFVTLHNHYRSTIENLIGFSEKLGGYFTTILPDAMNDLKNGAYYTYYFGKTRRWDGFMWLNYQTAQLKTTGHFKGDCGTNTCANMGLYKAAGIPPLSIQRSSLEHYLFTHNFPGYYDMLRNKWYAYQAFPRGDVDLHIYFHKYFPHHWIIDTEIKYTEDLIYSSLYQGETVRAIRAENFLSQGIHPDLVESLVVSDKTHIQGFIFNDDSAPSLIPDKDKDGLCDSHEVDLSTNPEKWDSDDDLLSDTWEILNGYDPDNHENPEKDIMAADGFVDDITHQKDYVQFSDRTNDSQVYTNSFDISNCYAVISNDTLHVGIQFSNDISKSRSINSELWLYTGDDVQVWYWIFCGSYFSGGTYVSDFCSMMKFEQNEWITISTDYDINYTLARDAEFVIPLKYFNHPDSISIKYSITSGPQDNEIRGSDEMDDYLHIHTYNFE